MKVQITIIAALVLAVLALQAAAFSDTTIIKKHLQALTAQPGFRNHANIKQLNNAAHYVQSVFLQYSNTVVVQNFDVDKSVYKNIVASFGIQNKQRIIIGAHYDVCGQQPGADDNASGVTGLLELARLLENQKLKYRIDLVAYSLEEPPYFRTPNMGSYVHAKFLADTKADVYGMVALEMIGYFSDSKDTQTYPVQSMAAMYGTTADFIALVKREKAETFASEFCHAFTAAKVIKTQTFAGPPSLPGIDFSDHLNYWKFGFSALMITDTSFYRNKNYHTAADTIHTLDLPRMAKVIDGVYVALQTLNSAPQK